MAWVISPPLSNGVIKSGGHSNENDLKKFRFLEKVFFKRDPYLIFGLLGDLGPKCDKMQSGPSGSSGE